MAVVTALYRYPVKSMQGERLDSADLGPLGFSFDRNWAVVDAATGVVLAAKRVPALLGASARVAGSDVRITLPGGEEVGTGDHAALSAWLGRPVRLVPAEPGVRAAMEIARDPFDDASEVVQWRGAPGTFHDSRNLHVLSVGSMAAMAAAAGPGAGDVRRWRPNVVVDLREAFAEQEWLGSQLAVGGAVVAVAKRTSRCVLVTRPQPGLGRDPEVLRAALAANAGDLGVTCDVVAGGTVRVGDRVGPVPSPAGD